MAEAALRLSDEFGHGEDFGSDIVKRLMARPIRTSPTPKRVDIAPVALPVEPRAEVIEETAPSDDLARLRSEIMVMKAVLRAEREEAANVRASIERLAGPAPLSPEACAVRDRWAALVDQLLDGHR
ncbi:hypothetical protein FPV16_10815 [Methylobacterium sp. W2]|uniref:hypothetical protein n=1 Tax=Methylobacterium sp. W2 TaxID=2598107 RepID=UPI001D0C423E|nr:hypothetical protein [Methylobacterium sp. W2]MCC0806709.1 hypothetical protein [Methylobacterium sp. W2]